MALDMNTLDKIRSMLELNTYTGGDPQEISVVFERACEEYLRYGKRIGIRRIQPQLLPLIAIVAECVEATAKSINEQKPKARGRPKNDRKHAESELVGSA
ncbi:hypothetical protein LCGC14_1704750 [marine sediment metagenome]|uniref:Uncharacterized protein n=1 Tax=marine sediment metagenome TaxID=412755 RepID=A0A0F9JXG3_9ZZZZ